MIIFHKEFWLSRKWKIGNVFLLLIIFQAFILLTKKTVGKFKKSNDMDLLDLQGHTSSVYTGCAKLSNTMIVCYYQKIGLFCGSNYHDLKHQSAL